MAAIADLIRRVLGGVTPGRAAASETTGTTGVLAFGGYLENKEKDGTLIGTRRYLTFDEMLVNTTIVAACSRFFLGLVARANWKVDPAEGTGIKKDQAEQRAEAVQNMMYGLKTNWHKVVRNTGLFKFRGFSIQEWTAAAASEDGVVGMADVEVRPQRTIERWDIEPKNGRFKGVWQRRPNDAVEVYLPAWKIIHAVDDTFTTDPDGLGLFRHCVVPWRRIQRYEQLEGVGFETDLRGIPIARAPLADLDRLVAQKSMTIEERNKLLEPLARITENHVRTQKTAVLLDSLTYTAEDGISTPSSVKQYDFELLKAQSNGLDSMGASIDRVLYEIAVVLGCEHLMLGRRREGSQALSRDKSQNLAVTVDGTLREIAEVLDTGLVAPFFELNGWDQKLRPSLKTEALQHRDIEQVTGALKDLAASGALLMPDDPAIKEVRDTLGLSRPTAANISDSVDASLNRGQPGKEPSDDGD